MAGNLLEKYVLSRKDEEKPAVEDSSDGLDDLGAFGFLRGVHDRAQMLELRHKDGRISAFGYAWLDRADFNPSDGISLYFGSRQVKISGRHLNAEVRPNVRLFSALMRHRVPWIQEADEPTALRAAKNAIVIESIEISP